MKFAVTETAVEEVLILLRRKYAPFDVHVTTFSNNEIRLMIVDTSSGCRASAEIPILGDGPELFIKRLIQATENLALSVQSKVLARLP